MPGAQPKPSLLQRRREVDEMLAARPVHHGVTIASATSSGVPVDVVTPLEQQRALTLLHFHGGGLRIGSVRTFRFFTSHLAAYLGCRVISVDYSLAPEHPFPTAFNESRRAYKAVASAATTPVVVIGESAGANLAAALLLSLRDSGLPAPLAGVLLSPWLDLRVIARSYDLNADTDLAFSKSSAAEASGLYRNGHPPTDPRVSPLLGDWRGQPPLLIQASDTEVLWDDATSMAEFARRDGVEVKLTCYQGQPHAWHYDAGSSEAAQTALSELATFLDNVAD